MKIKIKLYGASRDFSNQSFLNFEVEKNSTIKDIRNKIIDYLDNNCLSFIKNSTFCVLATSDGLNLDVSPKGDPAGFVKVLDKKTLVIPDRPGNNRIDGLLNLLKYPKIGLLFLIPSVDETLRINGSAEIIIDPNFSIFQTDIYARNSMFITFKTDKNIFNLRKKSIKGGIDLIS